MVLLTKTNFRRQGFRHLVFFFTANEIRVFVECIDLLPDGHLAYQPSQKMEFGESLEPIN